MISHTFTSSVKNNSGNGDESRDDIHTFVLIAISILNLKVFSHKSLADKLNYNFQLIFFSFINSKIYFFET